MRNLLERALSVIIGKLTHIWINECGVEFNDCRVRNALLLCVSDGGTV